MSFIFHKQPWKGLYLLTEVVVTAFILTPYWILRFSFKSSRPRASWTIRRCLMLKILQKISPSGSLIRRVGQIRRIPDHHAIVEGPGVKGVWVDPVPELVIGQVQQWAENAKVECVRIPGYWIEKKGFDFSIGQPPLPGEKVLYGLHGGGYMSQSAHPTDPTSNVIRGILQHTSINRCFNLEYRLTKRTETTLENPFPAALLDALAGYNYLVNVVGFSPDDIVIEGDSAGANLSLALVRYLVENQAAAGIPRPPGRMILNSPWGDVGESHNTGSNSTIVKNQHSDYLNFTKGSESRQVGLNFVGPLSWRAAETNRYISPGSRSPLMEKLSFARFPRTFITAGGAEVLLDSIRYLKDRMVEDMGEQRVAYWEAGDSMHDFLIFVSAQEPERSQALERIATWLAEE
ncbi:AB hydrolase superfamily protein [Abortiporus biennis]